MKKYFFFSMLIGLGFYACTKNNGVTNQPYTTYSINENSGQLKVNLAFAYTVDYSNIYIKLNGKTVGGPLQTRTPFPGGGYNTRGLNFANYLTVPQGSNSLKVVLAKYQSDVDSVVLFSQNININNNSAYTVHIADTAANTKYLLVKNEIKNVDSGFCRFRYVNLIPNVAATDLYLNGVLVKSNVPYMQSSDTFSVRTGVNAPGYNAAVTTFWAIRAAGALPTSTALASYSSANGLQNQQVMTLFSMGYSGGTAARLPFIALTLDKNQ